MIEFAAFILSRKRPNRVKTFGSLKKHGYTGKIIILLDDEDETADDYREQYGDQVIVFSRDDMDGKFDKGDNLDNKNTVVYARNACFEIAKDMGIKHFIMLDDDYLRFAYKFNTEHQYEERDIKNLDRIFAIMVEYQERTKALTVAMAQNGDFIGGRNSGYSQELKIKRKAMNTFICNTDRPFQFMGRINEDVNAYVTYGSRGKLLMTIPNIAINQTTTQKNKGGMTDVYLDDGTYVKSFYSVMYAPSSVKVTMMGDKHKRLHHQVAWNNTVPAIISEELKKGIS